MSKAEQQTRIRKIMIYALNAALRAGVIPPEARDNGVTESECSEITVCGKPTIINWCDTGHNELRVSVWWDYRPEGLPKLMKNRLHDLTLPLPGIYRDRLRLIVGLCASCYFNCHRKRGVLSDKGNDFFFCLCSRIYSQSYRRTGRCGAFRLFHIGVIPAITKNDFTTSRR